MPATATMSVSGLDDLTAKFEALAAFAQKDAVVEALKAGAEIIREEEQREAPEKTGALKRAIRVRNGRKSQTSFSVLLSASRRWFSGPTFYAGFQEFGFKTGTRKSANRKQIPGEHFALHSFEDKGKAASDAILEALKAGIERELATAKSLASVK